MIRFVLRALPALVVMLLLVAPAQAATDARAAAGRPSVAIVKRALITHYATDAQYGPWKNRIAFKTLRLLATRSSVPNRDFIEPGKKVTPVSSSFILTSRDTKNGYCFVYSYSFTGIFWRGDFGWEFKNRDVKYKRIADSC